MTAILIIGAAVIVLLVVSCSSLERSLLFYPSHHEPGEAMARWEIDSRLVGFARTVDSPKNIWLMLHGNGGQAEHRQYALPRFSPTDSVYILEYPGYGIREGRPSVKSFNQAAEEGYRFLRSKYPHLPVCVAAESIGSGPASFLASSERPPDKVVLVVPFDQLSKVAKDHYPGFLVGMLLSDDWNNVAALSKYQGPVEIYGAKFDTIIPVTHAQALAAALPQARFTLINCGHNDWSEQPEVNFRNP